MQAVTNVTIHDRPATAGGGVNDGGNGNTWLRRIGVLLATLALHGPAMAQAPDQKAGGATVAWTAQGVTAAQPGGRAAFVLQGAIREGWHVYALKQRPGGPTPLRVAVDANDIAATEGAPKGSPPTIAFEPAFGVQTPYYTRAATLIVPVRIKPRVAAGRQQVPVSVRFQTCNGQICEPPKTVHLSVPLDIGAGA